MGLVEDMAPVVKTLQEAHEASLLYDEDEDALVESASDRRTRSMKLLVNDPNLTWVHCPVLLRHGKQQPPLTVRWILLSLK